VVTTAGLESAFAAKPDADALAGADAVLHGLDELTVDTVRALRPGRD
jgi:hypothetical protein